MSSAARDRAGSGGDRGSARRRDVSRDRPGHRRSFAHEQNGTPQPTAPASGAPAGPRTGTTRAIAGQRGALAARVDRVRRARPAPARDRSSDRRSPAPAAHHEVDRCARRACRRRSRAHQPPRATALPPGSPRNRHRRRRPERDDQPPAPDRAVHQRDSPLPAAGARPPRPRTRLVEIAHPTFAVAIAGGLK